MITLATLDQYASQVAGTPVVIECDAPAQMVPGDAGFVLRGADGSILNIIHISTDECAKAESVDRPRARNLPRYFLDDADQRADLISGPPLEVILHEAMHISLQSLNEGLVECTAFQNSWALVRLFKLPAWVANTVLAGIAWRHEQLTGIYRTVC